MKRRKQCQHTRRLRSGRKIIVNKGVKKRNYGYMPNKLTKSEILRKYNLTEADIKRSRRKGIHEQTDNEYQANRELGIYLAFPIYNRKRYK